MAEAGSASDMDPQPPSNPDAQTTVNDFLDYTEFFPSDLIRSLTLIGNLDSSYLEATDAVHRLTRTYGNLPHLPADQRSDPQALRKRISHALNHAVSCRESTYAEASRLYDVAQRHCQRLNVIKSKLEALPMPPSRDPSPVCESPRQTRSPRAVRSPHTTRSQNRGIERPPRIRLNVDNIAYGPRAAARPRDRARKSGIARAALPANSGEGTEVSNSEAEAEATTAKSLVTPQLKHPMQKMKAIPKPGNRDKPATVVGTNVHSQIAGISTSNALAKLSPPPAESPPGSRHAPWFRLTEWEMAVLRKQMKKNAVWSPSDTMMRRELQRKGRGRENFEKERERCEATGLEMLDDDRVNINTKSTKPLASGAISTDPDPSPNETMLNRGARLSEAKKLKRASLLREQVMPDAQATELASRKPMDGENTANNGLGRGAEEGGPTTPAQEKRKDSLKPSRKRRRESTPPANASGTAAGLATPAAGPKRLRIVPPSAPSIAPQPDVPASGISPFAMAATGVHPPSKSAAPVARMRTPQAATLPLETVKTTTIQVPLAPAGPSTPAQNKAPKSPGPKQTLAVSPTESKKAVPPLVQQIQPTAASSRPRRESAAVTAKNTSPTTATKPSSSKAASPLEAVPLTARPRSAHGRVRTPKALSAEPSGKTAATGREKRRASNVSLPAIAAAATRTSARRRPPPKGDVTADEDGKNHITIVKRAQGSRARKQTSDVAQPEDEAPAEEDIDPDEPRYCICDNVSYGSMIACENAKARASSAPVPLSMPFVSPWAGLAAQ